MTYIWGMSITSFFLGLIMMALGVLGLKYNYQLTNNFGSFGSLTSFLGTGNEYAVFKLLALLLVFAGFVTMFGLGDNVLNFLLSPLRGILGGAS